MIAVLLGTPLAWLLARSRARAARLAASLLDLPLVLPPTVAGIALLTAFGRSGYLGDALGGVGVTLSFTTAAVVLAQLFVSAPFYVRSAYAGFAGTDPRFEGVAYTLGLSRWRTFRSVHAAAGLALAGRRRGALLGARTRRAGRDAAVRGLAARQDADDAARDPRRLRVGGGDRRRGLALGRAARLRRRAAARAASRHRIGRGVPMTLRAQFEARVGDFDLSVALDADDELVVLYGRSGSGKSLTLRAITGLLRPRSGRIEIGGRTVFDAAAGVDLPPQERRSGYVVQESTLFPHLDLRRNVLIGLERDVDAPARYEQLLRLLSIEGSRRATAAPALRRQQQQRAALARALVRHSDVLLLDEPFSALDEALRADLRAELLRLRREMRLSIVFVTHDLREAHLLADRIAVLDEGRVLQFAPRDEVFRRPASRLVAELTGFSNIFEAHQHAEGVAVAGLALRAAVPAGVADSETVDVAIRAERCVLRRVDPDSGLPENCFVARIVDDLAFGNTHTLHLVPEGAGPPIAVEVASRPYEILGLAARGALGGGVAGGGSARHVAGSGSGRVGSKLVRGPDGRRRNAFGRAAGGKSELLRTGRRLTAGRREPTGKCHRNIPPSRASVRGGKGEMVR